MILKNYDLRSRLQVQKAKQGYKLVKSFFGKYEEIPEDWSRKSLNEIGELSAGGTPSTFNKDYWDEGTIPWVSSGEVKNNRISDSEKKITESGLKNSAAKLFPTGTILVAITGFGMTRGRTSILEIDASTNQSVIGIISEDNIANNEFVWFALQKQYQTLRNFAQGTQQPGLNLDILKKFRLFLPNNVTVQHKIASILSNVDSLINQTQKIIEQTQRLKKGLMQKILTKGTEHKKLKKTKYGNIPENWEITDIGSVASVTKLAGFEYTKYIKLSDVGEIPVIRAQNVQMGKFIEENIKYISKEVSNLLPRSQLHGNEVLMTFIGQVGNVCLAPTDRKWHLAPNVAKITPRKVDQKYLCYFLQSHIGISNSLSWAKATVQSSLSMRTIRKIELFFPPYDEQIKIANILSRFDSYLEKQIQHKSKLENLKKGLMQKLLTGQIRVKV